ncbi:hypothetical protein M569_16588, partial [Genlisea aurea]
GVSCMNFEFHRSGNNGGNSRASSHHRTPPLGKPTPSKWDDAQKWLVNLSRGDKKPANKASPRNSNADDRRLIPVVPKKDYSSGDEDRGWAQTKNVQFEEEPPWKNHKQHHQSCSRICLRDMGTEMTPFGSQEPSRTATPIRASSPVTLSPSDSPAAGVVAHHESETNRTREIIGSENNSLDLQSNQRMMMINHPLEVRAIAWDEAERAKYMARYKREEVKIQAWENHQKMTAELEMRKVEVVKAERQKTRAQEKYAKKLATVRRTAEERRANAEEKLNLKAVKTSERAEYIRRTGHLPSSISMKLPSFCW